MPEQINFLSNTLDDVIQNGALDIPKLMTSIMQMYDCKEGYFFEVEHIDEFVCLFSSSDLYTVSNKYTLQDIPFETFNIFVRDAIVAVLAFDIPPIPFLEKMHNTIAISLHFSKMQTSDREFLLTTTTQILGYIQDMLKQIVGRPPITPTTQTEKSRLEKAVKDMSESIDILRNVHDYALLTANRLQLKSTDIDIRKSISSTIQVVGNNLKYEINANVPTMINIDQRRFQLDIMLPIFQNLLDIAPHVRVVFNCTGNEVANGQIEIIVTTDESVELPKNIQQVVRSRYVIPEYLRLFMAKELCRATGGFTQLYSPFHVLFNVGFQYTRTDNVWYGKRVIVFINTRKIRDTIYTMLSNMGAIVTIFNDDDASLYFNTLGSYQIAVLESSNEYYISHYLKRIRDRGLDVIGVGKKPVLFNNDFTATVVGDSERELLDTYKNSLAQKN